MKKSFNDLSLQEVLALAIEIEKNNAERFRILAEMNLNYDKNLYSYFRELQKEELDHLTILKLRWQQKYGSLPIPCIDEMDVSEVIETVEVEHGEHQLFDDISKEKAYEIARKAELYAREFYLKAAKSATDRQSKELFTELAEFENSHVQRLEKSKPDK